jgi:DNA-binding CsgD family transcriptional regulator/tetratricopeptide (TPR) repeat protein
MELAFATLHQLCWPLMDHLDRIPGPQRDALATTFGLQASGPVPDRLVVGLAVLSLLAEAAGHRPLVCVVDDEQWLDHASAQVLAFVARRLEMESVALVFGARTLNDELAGLPHWVVDGLEPQDARALLDAVVTGPVDTRVRDQIVAETRGNPLALLELPRGLTPAQLAGGFGLPRVVASSSSIGEAFRQRIEVLPADSRRLLVLAAAETLGDPLVLWRAADSLGISRAAASPAVDAGLVVFESRVRFRHPLVRSAVYRSASEGERQEAHRALAAATDPELDPDRRAWHRAKATPGADEDVAVELERSADRAQARGGFAAAAAFLERAAVLTPDTAKRATRALAAAQAKVHAGDLSAGLELLAVAEGGPLGELDSARADLVRAQVAYITRRGGNAPFLLLTAAKRLEPIAPDLAWSTYADAMLAAVLAGRFAVPGGSTLEVAGAVRGGRGYAASASDLLVQGLAAHYLEGHRASLPILRNALSAWPGDLPVQRELRSAAMAYIAAQELWDDDAVEVLTARWARLCREQGALSDLPIVLSSRTMFLLFVGNISGAALLVEEMRGAADAIGIRIGAYAALGLAAFRGDEAEMSRLVDMSVREGPLRGEGSLQTVAMWTSAVLNNGLGHYEEALAAAQQATDSPDEVFWPNFALAELIEAAVRSGTRAPAIAAHGRIAQIADATAGDWALGLEARSRALLREGDEAERCYSEAIERLGRTRIRSELARAHLLYGEWLRRQRRPGDAREQLRTAHAMFDTMGMDGFAARARSELTASGEKATKRTVTISRDLTPREDQIATMARDGFSNAEIGTRLFISAHTVDYHLRKVFNKLGISSRSKLRDSLASGGVLSQGS